MKFSDELQEIMTQRFGHDNEIALVTMDGSIPYARTVNAYYENGAFYVITHGKSKKMQHIAQNPLVALCGDWFSAHGMASDAGHVLDAQNADLMQRIRIAFAAWYGNGHTNEQDPNTRILQIRLSDGILFHHGTRYEITFS